jgi:sugar lactone lactonase YvrE
MVSSICSNVSGTRRTETQEAKGASKARGIRIMNRHLPTTLLGSLLLLGVSLSACDSSSVNEGNALSPSVAQEDAAFRGEQTADTGAPMGPTVDCIDLDGDGFGEGCEGGPDCDDRSMSSHPGATEQCGDGLDNDCDRETEEGCGCNDGEALPCYPGPEETMAVGRCQSGYQVCRNGSLGVCEGSRVPATEICNGTDDDCDGQLDEGTTNACGACGDLPAEVCDGADNDCDGTIDEGLFNACGQCGVPPEEFCDVIDNDCDGTVDEGCRCIASVPERCYTGAAGTEGVGGCTAGFWLCSEGERAGCIDQVLPAAQEVCNGLDDNCNGEIDEGLTNRCGECGAQPEERCDGPTRDFGNGLDDDCDGRIDETCNCNDRLNQPCYSGLPKTLGKGACVGGVADCVDGRVTQCRGEVTPQEEMCGDGVDSDCDGRVDEGCAVQDCVAEVETCNGLDDDCNGRVDEGLRGPCGCIEPGAEEVCGDGFDNDCDGRVEEICGCRKGPALRCYGGPPETLDVGQCRAGLFECVPGERLQQTDASGCRDWVGPRAEMCNGLDDDCDGTTDENSIDANACGQCGQTPIELCNGLDDDCDGVIDEGVSNACGQCGDLPIETCDQIDNDCDGLTDEGVVNYCGACGQSCFTVVFDDQPDWERGTPINLISSGENPDGLTLSSADVRGDSYLWVAAYRDREVVKIDTRTCEVEDFFPTHGYSPSRTAVATDGSVWVGNRGMHGGNAANYEHGNAVHLDSDGSVICRAQITSGQGSGGVAVRAAAIDQEGNAWLGSWSRRSIYRVSGYEVEPGDGPADIPNCRILQEIQLPGPAYGAAVDSRGFLWIAASPAKIDTRDGQLVGIVPQRGLVVGGPNDGETISLRFYGMAIDRNDNVWYAVTNPPGYLARIDGRTHEMHAFYHGGGTTRGVAVDLDGNIWGGGGALYKMSPEGEHLLTVPNAGAVGVAVDADNGIWAVGGSSARRFDPRDGRQLCDVGRLPSLYTYSDMTGMQLISVTLRRGTWTVRLDGGAPDVRWDSIDWNGVFGDGVMVDGRVRTAPTIDGLPGATWSARSDATPFQIPPRTPQSEFTPDNRWIEIEMRVSRQDDAVSPVLQRVRVHFQRP